MRGFRIDYGRQSPCISVERFMHLRCGDQHDFDLSEAPQIDPALKKLSFVFQSSLSHLIIVELRTPAMPVGVGGGKERGGFHLN